MLAEKNRSVGRRSRSLAQLERDAALFRVGRLRRGLIVAAAALTAGFAALVSAIAPGRSSGHTRSTTAAAATGSTSGSTRAFKRMPPLASAGALGLQGPSEAPQAAPSQSSGASSQSAPDSSAAVPAPTPAPAAPVSGGS